MASPYLSNYRNGEYLQYMRDVLDIVTVNATDGNVLPKAISDLSNVVKRIENVYMMPKKSDLTKTIVALNAKRNAAITGIKGLVKSLTYHFDEAIALPARLILKRIKAYGTDIPSCHYQEESEILNRLITDFETLPEYITAINTLMLVKDWLAELKTVNELFIETYLQRISENAVKHSKATVTELRVDATKAYRNLMAKVNAYKTITDSEDYTVILKQLHLLTRQYNQVVYNRRKPAVAKHSVELSCIDTGANIHGEAHDQDQQLPEDDLRRLNVSLASWFNTNKVYTRRKGIPSSEKPYNEHNITIP